MRLCSLGVATIEGGVLFVISIISIYDRILKYAAQRVGIALRGTLLRNSTAFLLVKESTQMCRSWKKMKPELKNKFASGQCFGHFKFVVNDTLQVKYPAIKLASSL